MVRPWQARCTYSFLLSSRVTLGVHASRSHPIVNQKRKCSKAVIGAPHLNYVYEISGRDEGRSNHPTGTVGPGRVSYR